MYVDTHVMVLQVLCAWLPQQVICPNTAWPNLDRRNENDILLTSGTTGSYPNTGLTPPAKRQAACCMQGQTRWAAVRDGDDQQMADSSMTAAAPVAAPDPLLLFLGVIGAEKMPSRPQH
jgi:hypothetical protein